MSRITAAEIRELTTHTRAGAVAWAVNGRRCRANDYLLELRANGGPRLSRVEPNGVTEVASIRSVVGLMPRGRALHALASAVERQATIDDDELDLTATEPTDIEISLAPAEPPAPSPRWPSWRTGASAPGRASDRA